MQKLVVSTQTLTDVIVQLPQTIVATLATINRQPTSATRNELLRNMKGVSHYISHHKVPHQHPPYIHSYKILMFHIGRVLGIEYVVY